MQSQFLQLRYVHFFYHELKFMATKTQTWLWHSEDRNKFDILLIWIITKTYKTTASASYEPVLHCDKKILNLQTIYGQVLMYLIFQSCFYIFSIDVLKLTEDDQDRSKHECVKI